MMILKILILIASVSFISDETSTQEIDCKSVRTGKFKLINEELNLRYLIERNDSVQFETKLTTGEKSQYRIIWTGKCEYELEILSGPEELMAFFKDRNLKVEILEVTKDEYKFRSTIEGTDHDQTFVILRVK